MPQAIPITPQLVNDAYAALASGDLGTIRQYWSQDLVWLVPGHHALAGAYRGLDAFLDFMRKTAQLSNNSFRMDLITVLTNDEYSADVTHNLGFRTKTAEDTTSPYSKLDIDVIHLLRWRDGKVIEGRGAIFGDGTSRFDQFWSQVAADGARTNQ
ncbi:nuclear transport factor 2 family protein [Sorangium sp. So ce291]|uniref:nuclear transport factor 2 family protein n=1 Tax=Sorangium sp. So ce291 TaxID=3133294 RepID=UPI003F6491A2